MPSLGLGTWLSKRGEVRDAVREAIKMGYRHLDAAWIYGNEDEVGKGIADCIKEGIVRREDLFVTSKLWNTFHDPEDVPKALNDSLNKLGLEYLDLYLIHWPLAFKRSIGVSNFGIGGLKSLLSRSTIKPAVNQVEGHPYLEQWPLLKFCKEQKIAVTAYSPLGSPGRYSYTCNGSAVIDHSNRDVKASGEPHLLSEPSVIRIAGSLNCTPAQVLLLWGWHRGTIVIPKSVTKRRLQENLEVFQDMLSGKKALSRTLVKREIMVGDSGKRVPEGSWL
ncbi:hypothetical protein GUITHDRAFT_157250 [Guillardia theta CCMP2712]|uniref:NADP-dependent oxidoreductase domain-containing protein n=1 Tax=Guillardia theta (strain CCMP2712) TaxID=905079 RepID=L1JRT5_GUITC|nr:hypothetical protein GUITHDRAFT_157250 [Guillardia theta CCMP2712]EKX50778.1 hypothetical protein GUITHDRAFT_157250 [Guillardia theta CCMP2712]|eukprot:XP_005837758.1 hypothetical protein GUITHDRAFT_157250 [Guillardia theta CCMP2712]